MRKKRSRQKVAPSIPAIPAEVRRALGYVGLFTRVASAEGLSLGHVVEVAKGRRISRRVVDAITREVRKIESGAEIAA